MPFPAQGLTQKEHCFVQQDRNSHFIKDTLKLRMLLEEISRFRKTGRCLEWRRTSLTLSSEAATVVQLLTDVTGRLKSVTAHLPATSFKKVPMSHLSKKC